MTTKKAFLKYLLIFNSINGFLIVFTLYILPIIDVGHWWRLGLIYLLEILIFTGVSYFLNAPLIKSKFRLLLFLLFINISYISIDSSRIEKTKATQLVQQVAEISTDDKYWKIASLELNTSLIYHSYHRGTSGRNSAFHYYQHFYAIPVVEGLERYNTWLIVNQEQRIGKIWDEEKVKKDLAFFRKYYLDSLRHLNPKNVKYYEASHTDLFKESKDLLLRRIAKSDLSSREVTLLYPYYKDIQTHKAKENSTFNWMIIFTIVVFSFLALYKAAGHAR
jgi:hypothetical protein